VLTEAEVQKLSERFLFKDAAGAMATGPIGAATRVSLGLVVVADKVRAALWRNRRPDIKAVMDDEQGRFDKQELLAHIINNALGRPILYSTDARTVGVAADNALAKENKDTKEAKKIADEAIRTARAAAAKDPSLLPQLAAAQAARDVTLAAVLAQTYDLKRPNSTVGAVKKPAPIADLSQQLQRAEAALRVAEERGQEAKRSQRELLPRGDVQFPEDLDDTTGEAAVLRRWDRVQEMHSAAGDEVVAAYSALAKAVREVNRLSDLHEEEK